VLLLSRELDPDGFRGVILGQAAVLLAAIFYAASAVFVRRNLSEVPPLVQAFMPLIAADALVWLVMPVAESPIRFPTEGETWFAILWLGLLGTFIAYILYFSLLQSVGPTKTTLVTYVVPVVGVILGVLFLEEILDLQLVLGMILVIAGIGVVNWVPRATKPSSI
jgi:drug/metabolite transporter (DMT)-like permease